MEVLAAKTGCKSANTVESDCGADQKKLAGTKLPNAKLAQKKIKKPLFEIEWFRIVLDEGHSIKNRKSQ